MHPFTYSMHLWTPEIRDEVFVIMSFDEQFEARWCDVIEPVIQDLGFIANRVDYRTGGDSIVADILDGIGHARLVLADVTSTLLADESGKKWPVRNGNVMWELGVAQAMRLPDEVIIMRSDDDDVLFDMQYRVFHFDEAKRVTTKEWLRKLLRDRAQMVDRGKAKIVESITQQLDPGAAAWMFERLGEGNTPEFEVTLDMQTQMRVPRLFELGLVKLGRLFVRDKKVVARCSVTPLGGIVLQTLAVAWKAAARPSD